MPATDKTESRRIEIEFTETCSEIGLKSYTGKKLTLELIKEIQQWDESLVNADLGYFKFYFDEYVNDEIINSLRVDIGDGIRNNQQYYDYLEGFLK
ncbi:hypothetical protein [Lactococcus lactis]|uniref:hypothetical protein n=1 Tax=Lactococcus lactis TaxID=1358 RepID=UPI00223B2EAE|nr:hypothetical protein [Lactococcus lactis]MCT0449987.1 hypothetical protein [Lactococcus lactis subsp. lactis]